MVTLGDTQFRPARNGEPSGEDPRVLREIVLPFIKLFKPRTVVHKGDLIDLPSLSKYESHLGDAEAVETALEDYRYTNTWLDEIEEASSGALDYVIEGNHEVRAKKWASRASRRHLRETVNVEKNLRFKERGIRYIPYWSNKIKLLTLGKANFCHGLSTAPTHARVMAGKYPGMNLYYGHCFDMETEVLTESGWRHRHELTTDLRVATWKDGVIEYQRPLSFSDYSYWPSMVSINNTSVNLLVTDQHGLVWRNDRGEEVRGTAASFWDTKSPKQFICAGETAIEDNPKYSDDLLRLINWIAADGSLENSTLVRFHLKKKRKVKMLLELLMRLGFDPRVTYGETTRISFNWCTDVFTWGSKELPRLVLSSRQKRLLLHEYVYTDGSKTGPHSFQVSTAKETEADLIQEMSVTSGWRCNKTKTKGGWVLSINTQHSTSWVQNKRAVAVSGAGPVWCLRVPNGTLVVRRGGKVCVTQNTHDRQFYSPHYLHEVGSDGCLCRLYQPYNEGAPTNWRHGFSAFTFFKGGGYICEPILIVNDRMCFGGKLFKGR